MSDVANKLNGVAQALFAMQQNCAAIQRLIAGPQRRFEIAPMWRECGGRPTPLVGIPSLVVIAESKLGHAEFKFRFCVIRIEHDGFAQVRYGFLKAIKPTQRVRPIGEELCAMAFDPTHLVVTVNRFGWAIEPHERIAPVAERFGMV